MYISEATPALGQLGLGQRTDSIKRVNINYYFHYCERQNNREYVLSEFSKEEKKGKVEGKKVEPKWLKNGNYKKDVVT